MLLYFYMLKMCFTHSISLGLLWFFWHVCHCLLILCFIHDMLFCIQSKNVFYYFCLMNLHWCKTICHVQNAQHTSCILGWLFFLIYLFLLLYQKKKKKIRIQNTVSEIDIWFEVFLMVIMRGPCILYLSYIIEIIP